MPKAKAGVAVPSAYDWRESGVDAAKHAYYRWISRDSLVDDPERLTAFDAGFVRGARWGVQTTSTLSPAVASLIAFVEWLREHEEMSV